MQTNSMTIGVRNHFSKFGAPTIRPILNMVAAVPVRVTVRFEEFVEGLNDELVDVAHNLLRATDFAKGALSPRAWKTEAVTTFLWFAMGGTAALRAKMGIGFFGRPSEAQREEARRAEITKKRRPRSPAEDARVSAEVPHGAFLFGAHPNRCRGGLCKALPQTRRHAPTAWRFRGTWKAASTPCPANRHLGAEAVVRRVADCQALPARPAAVRFWMAD